MSASRDKSQKIGFVFSNLYHLYKKGKEAASAAEVPSEAASLMDVHAEGPLKISPQAGLVIKTGDLKQQAAAQTYNAAEFLALRVGVAEAAKRQHRPATTAVSPAAGKRVPRPPVLPASHAVISLRENLKALNDLHSRLRFMLQELEELVKE